MAFEGFLEVKGIQGESKDAKHPKWIDVDRFAFGATLTNFQWGPDGVPVAKGPGQLQNITFTQQMHRGSPALFEYCLRGTPVETVKFHACKSAGGEALIYFEAVFSQCLILSVGTDSQGGDTSVETLVVAFRKVELIYREQHSGTGGVHKEFAGSFDRAAGQ